MQKATVNQGQATLPVMEAFYTIQGEGYHQGKAAYFIRLGGCDVGCVWCDVKESWDVDAFPHEQVDSIVANGRQYNSRMAVVTGGEPLMHNLDVLTSSLRKAGFATNIETSGAHPLSGEWDWICLSPKKFKAPREEILSRANELKIVVYNKSDFDWGEKYADRVNPGCQLFLQPEWGKERKMIPLIVEYVKQNPQWQISLQTHKYMNVP